MARKRPQLSCVKVVRRHPEGSRRIMRGIFSFYETQGFPLDQILALLWTNKDEALPDWADLVRSMVKAGRTVERSFGAVRTAIDDACYPAPVRIELQTRLDLLEQRWSRYENDP